MFKVPIPENICEQLTKYPNIAIEFLTSVSLLFDNENVRATYLNSEYDTFDDLISAIEKHCKDIETRTARLNKLVNSTDFKEKYRRLIQPLNE